MTFLDAFLGEYDHEMNTTRSLLERVPLEKFDWKPHPKSTSLGVLASHLANLAGYGGRVATSNEINFAPPGGGTFTPTFYRTREELLRAFDDNVKKTRELVCGLSEHQLREPWSLKNGDVTIFTLPRSATLRSFMMNHMIHHRGQLSVYLRENNVPLPSIYGPTADM